MLDGRIIANDVCDTDEDGVLMNYFQIHGNFYGGTGRKHENLQSELPIFGAIIGHEASRIRPQKFQLR
jgi:hypothetical protein